MKQPISMLAILFCVGIMAQAHATTPQTAPKKKKNAELLIQPNQVNGLKFGQVVNKKNLTQAGFHYPKDANNECYYVPLDKVSAKPAPNILIIDHNRLGLIAIRRGSVQIFSNIKLNDPVGKVIKAHNTQPNYFVDKYDDGNSKSYHLVYDLPNGNQIDYRMTGGSKMPSDDIPKQKWNANYAQKLTGTVESIAVGQKATIALAEGCS